MALAPQVHGIKHHLHSAEILNIYVDLHWLTCVSLSYGRVVSRLWLEHHLHCVKVIHVHSLEDRFVLRDVLCRVILWRHHLSLEKLLHRTKLFRSYLDDMGLCLKKIYILLWLLSLRFFLHWNLSQIDFILRSHPAVISIEIVREAIFFGIDHFIPIFTLDRFDRWFEGICSHRAYF